MKVSSDPHCLSEATRVTAEGTGPIGGQVVRADTDTLLGPAALSSGPPQVPDQAKLLQYTRTQGQGFAMFCQAQGYPVPSFR